MSSERGGPDSGVSILAERQGPLWVVAVLFYGLGDGATTYLGLRAGRAAEAGPIAARFVAAHGIAGLVVLKVVTLVGFYAMWRFVGRQSRVAVPLAVAVVGVGVTLWNLVVLYG